MEEVAFRDRLDSAFCAFNKKIDDRVDTRIQHHKAEASLKQELLGLRDEQQRLLTEIQEKKKLNNVAREQNRLALEAENERLRKAEGNRDYWRSIVDIMKSFFHVDFKCHDAENPTAVTMGFFKDSTGVSQRSIPVSGDDVQLSAADVDYNWRMVELVHQPKTKRALLNS